MKLLEENISLTVDENYIIETLNLNDKKILELGCGTASMTQKIASNGFSREIIACDVDEIQYKKNLKLNIPNIKFMLCGAEDIKLKDDSVDFIFMFKSFHHIPKEFMNKALDEIQRVLKPNGMAYISEPLFIGKQNELVSFFHNEEQERIDAFEAIKASVDEEKFRLFKEFFFQTEVTYENFEDFEKKHIENRDINNNISKEMKEKIKKRYEDLGEGRVSLLKPFRVDILQKW
ncbi:class I SAM-dependent methyltransferase [Halarcobacter anaerophilus]|jgi:ubiquinone/menaquinone biosynthesis C-methylase UbiE|uniref:class I SAM-dependent methyltransferase n=1 Tax=Halarcobacter anaerophilus TaxID=877500 RepID=UPI0005CACB98|nr:class I SAM-dependent methyltransferase [Halarcobacter anaerophilus]